MPTVRWLPSGAQPALERNCRVGSSVERTHQVALSNPSARIVSATAFSSREPWPRRCAWGSTTNSATTPSVSGLESGSSDGPMAAKPTRRPSPTATSTLNCASGGRVIAASHCFVIVARSMLARTDPATSGGNRCCHERRWIAAMVSASPGRARRTESGNWEGTCVTDPMLSVSGGSTTFVARV